VINNNNNNNNNNKNGTLSKSFRKYLNNTPGKHEIKEPHKTATMGNAHRLKTVVMQNYKTFSLANSITSTMYCYRAIAAANIP
jgi:hypothetical protein